MFVHSLTSQSLLLPLKNWNFILKIPKIDSLMFYNWIFVTYVTLLNLMNYKRFCSLSDLPDVVVLTETWLDSKAGLCYLLTPLSTLVWNDLMILLVMVFVFTLSKVILPRPLILSHDFHTLNTRKFVQILICCKICFVSICRPPNTNLTNYLSNLMNIYS